MCITHIMISFFRSLKIIKNYSSGLHIVHYIKRKKKKEEEDLQHIIPLFFIFYLKKEARTPERWRVCEGQPGSS
jgi:hypothetical protein